MVIANSRASAAVASAGPRSITVGRVDAQQTERLDPFGEAGVEVDVDAREAPGVQAGQVRDQRLRAIGVACHHGADHMTATEAP